VKSRRRSADKDRVWKDAMEPGGGGEYQLSINRFYAF
jgi:hypothetical protein